MQSCSNRQVETTQGGQEEEGGWTGSAGVAEVVMKKLIGKKTKGRGYRHPAKNWRDEDFGSDECACMCPERCNCSGYKRFKC